MQYSLNGKQLPVGDRRPNEKQVFETKRVAMQRGSPGISKGYVAIYT
jgi:hypothetical protein